MSMTSTGVLCSITYADAGDQNVVTAIFGCIVCASMGFDAPIARKLRWYASSTWQMCGAIEEREIGGDQIGTIHRSYRKFRCEMIWKHENFIWVQSDVLAGWPALIWYGMASALVRVHISFRNSEQIIVIFCKWPDSFVRLIYLINNIFTFRIVFFILANEGDL